MSKLKKDISRVLVRSIIEEQRFSYELMQNSEHNYQELIKKTTGAYLTAKRLQLPEETIMIQELQKYIINAFKKTKNKYVILYN
ncbi:hypothetical protein H8D36_05725 [archaeon]|nr:hypothetical protein [archaeon]MBL7057046.1 hypothetical protein [Candidatus Woesearchaeota archaeon]